MRKTLLLSILLAGTLGCSAIALAAPGGQGGWHHRGHGHAGMQSLRKLNLTDAQKASIKQIVKQSFAQLKPQMQSVRQQRSALAALTPDAPGYQAQAASLAQAEASFTSARIIQQAATKAQIYAVLNTTQKAQLASQKAARQARIQQWKQFKAQHPLTSSN